MGEVSVVITGVGLVCPAGLSANDAWAAVIEKRSAVRKSSETSFSGDPTLVADLRGFEPDSEVVNSKVSKFFLREDYIGLSAARMALNDAGLLPDSDTLRQAGLFVASGKDEMRTDLLSDGFRACMENDLISNRLLGLRGMRSFHPFSLLQAMPNTCMFGVSAIFGLRGPNLTFVSTGAGGAQAVGEAFQAIRQGECNLSLAGAADSRLEPFSIAAFRAAGVLSQGIQEPQLAMRPFDSCRDGYVLGEGGSFLLLEARSHAEARGAFPQAELVGYAANKGADSSGSGIAVSIDACLQRAGLMPSEVDAVFAWGDCTGNGDLAEATALKAVFGRHCENLSLCCVKPVTGNMLGTSAVAELALACMAIQRGIVPPTLNQQSPDPSCGVTGLSSEPVVKNLRVVLCLARGIHGQTTALALKAT